MPSDPTFNEDDFDLDESTDQTPPTLEPDNPQPAVPKRASMSRKKLALAVSGVCAAIGLSVIGVAVYLGNSSNSELSDFTAEPGFELRDPDSRDFGSPEDASFKVSIGDDGVKINDVESQIATAILDSRPTHLEVDQQINSRLNELFNDPESLALLRQMNREDRQQILRAIEGLKASQAALQQSVSEVRADLAEVKERQKASDGRQASLESKLKSLSAKPKEKLATAKRVVLEPRLQWKVMAMTSSLAIIQNDKTGDKKRVAVGHKIPGCGHVKSFDVNENSLTTTSGCVIKRRKA